MLRLQDTPVARAPKLHVTPLEQAAARARVENRTDTTPGTLFSPANLTLRSAEAPRPATSLFADDGGAFSGGPDFPSPSTQPERRASLLQPEDRLNANDLPGVESMDDIRPWLAGLTGASAGSTPRFPETALGRSWQHLRRLTRSAEIGLVRVFQGNAADAWAIAKLEDGRWPSRPLRLGVTDPALRLDLSLTMGSCETEWVDVTPDRTPMELCRRLHLDALLMVDVRGGLNLTTPETRQRAAAWHDWASARPVTFSALFPGRVDCAELKLPSDAGRPSALPLLRALIEAAAVFSRHPSRLSLSDRLNGRLPMIETRRELTLPTTGNAGRDAQRLVVQRLCDLLAKPMELANVAASRAAARLVSAYATGVDDDLPEPERLEMVETAARVSGEEPEVLLRLAAARFASYEDDAGLQALLRAERTLRTHELNAGSTQLPFLQAEIEMGQGTPISLGRVAAGVAMVSASAPSTHLGFLRDDLLDDARYSGWSQRQDQDRNLLAEVFGVLIESRSGESSSPFWPTALTGQQQAA